MSPAATSDLTPTLAAARAGDPQAFGTLISEYEVRLLSQSLALCRHDHTLAEDLVQETFVAAWRSLPRYDEAACRFATWLYAILLHRYRKALRRARLRPFFCLDAASRDAALECLHALDGTPVDHAVRDERAAALAHAVTSLPARYAEVARLRFYADATLEEIASALDCPLGTVKSRLHHGLEKLRALSSNLFVLTGDKSLNSLLP